MKSGSTIYREIEKRTREQESSHESLSKELYSYESEISRLGEERESIFIKLATTYLPEMDAEAVKNTLPELRSQVESVFKEKQKRRTQIERAMQTSIEKEKTLEEMLKDTTEKLGAKAKERDEAKVKITGELERNDNYANMKTRFAQENEKLVRGGARVQEAQNEAAEKLPAYEKNRLFKYLLQRGFGAQQYNSGGLIKRMDSWVAKVVHFDENKQKYDFLLSMPELMKEEVQKQEEVVEKLGTELREVEEPIETKYRLPLIIQEGTILGATRDNLMAQIENLNVEQERYSAERKEMDSEKDPYHVQAVKDLKDYFKGEEIYRLKEMARKTPGTEDDRMCDRLQEIDLSVRDFKDKSKVTKKQRDELEEKVEGLKRISTKYRNKDYESGRSRFKSSFDVDEFLTGYMLGKYSEDQVWKEIKEKQEFEPEPVYIPSYSSPSYSSSSSSRRRSSSSSSSSSSWGGSFGGGSHSSGGGFGGGGFSSGGGFGGGGFSSGGRGF